MAKLSPGEGYFDIDGKPYTQGLLTSYAVDDVVYIQSQSGNFVNIAKNYSLFTNSSDEHFDSAQDVVGYFKSIAFKKGGGGGEGPQM